MGKSRRRLSKKVMKKICVLMGVMILLQTVFPRVGGMENVMAAESMTVESYGGYAEGAYVTWKPVEGANGYLVSMSKDAVEWVQIDNELIRNYGSYVRADALGLTTGKWYIKIEAAIFDDDKNKIGTLTEMVQEVEVGAYDRDEVVCDENRIVSGAYNQDGSLKENAKIIYITENTKDTDSINWNDPATNQCMGLQTILKEYKENMSSIPLCIRIIGNVTAPADLVEGKFVVDGMTEGLTIEGVGKDAVVNGWEIVLQNSANVEIRNLAFMNGNPQIKSEDTEKAKNNNHVWVHNCDIFGGNYEKIENAVQSEEASTYVTFSYNHFWGAGSFALWDMMKAGGKPTQNILHHNWYDHVEYPYLSEDSCVVCYDNYEDLFLEDIAEDEETLLPENAEVVANVKENAGRLHGGDFQWEFDENEEYAIENERLMEACTDYTSSLVSVGGIPMDAGFGVTSLVQEENRSQVTPDIGYENDNYEKDTESTDFATGRKVEETKNDIQVIPDIYNTGCKGELTTLEMDVNNPMLVNGVTFVSGSEGTRFVLDFYYRNKNITGTVFIENYDFSACSLWSYNEEKVDREIKVVFNNCKFGGVSTGRKDGKVSFEFNNCTITDFSGSNSVFNRCQFGHTYSDGLVPFVDIEVNDCFFLDMAGMITDKDLHIDGTQIYGIEGTDINHVIYQNCRFEIPPLSKEGNAACVNACIMLQIEYSNGKDIHFIDNMVNGGGYSIYAHSKFEHLGFEDVSFEGIRFGDASKYGIFYSKIHKDIRISDVARTDSLYIGSVWKENGKTHFSVTNDTAQERELVIDTDQGVYTFKIPACYRNAEFTSELEYADFPFDMDIVIPTDCQYAVCYDNTVSGCGTQIRFVNWSEQEVYLSQEMEELLSAGNSSEVLLSGQCGANVTFTLTKAGVLYLSGTGATYAYHSAKSPEWIVYRDNIKEIVVEEGVTALGNQIFTYCLGLEKVTLPDSLVSIGSYVFRGCTSLEEFIFPPNIKEIHTNILGGTILKTVSYTGDDWNQVEIGEKNENWQELLNESRAGMRIRFVNADAEYVYTGSVIKPEIIVTNNRERLVEGVDYTVEYTNNINASTEKKQATIKVKGKGNLTGNSLATFQILPKNIGDPDVIEGSVVVVKGQKAVPVLTYHNKKLSSKDYRNPHASTKFMEDGVITLTGKGNYTGTREISVKVVEKVDLKQYKVTVGKEILVYNGLEQEPVISVTQKKTGETLEENTDYKIVYGNDKINAGTVKFKVIGMGTYTGTVSGSYKIHPLKVKDGSIKVSGVDEDGYEFIPGGVTIQNDLLVSRNGVTLTEGKDYKIIYSNNKKISTEKSKAKYTIQFLGNYKGSSSLQGTFAITPKKLSNETKGLKIMVGDKIYQGKPGVYKSSPIVSVNNVVLNPSNYKVSYYKDAEYTSQINGKNKIALEDSQTSIKVYVKIEGRGNYASLEGQYASASYEVCRKPVYNLSNARVTFWDGDKKVTKMQYTGFEVKPIVKVEVKVNKKWTEVPSDKYEVFYTNNVNKGTAKVMVIAVAADYAGSKTSTFKISAYNLKNLMDWLQHVLGGYGKIDKL